MTVFFLIIILILAIWIFFAERRCKTSQIALSSSLTAHAESADACKETLAIKDGIIKTLKADIAQLLASPPADETETIHSVTWLAKDGTEESQEFPTVIAAIKHREKLRKKRMKASYRAFSFLALLMVFASLVSCAKDVSGHWHYYGPRVTGTVGFNGVSLGLTVAGEDVSKATVEIVKQPGQPVEVRSSAEK